MRALARASAIIISLSVVMVVTYYTLVQNLQAGVYPTDADSIAIGLFETADSLIVILAPLALAFLLTNLKYLQKRFILLVGAFLYLAGAALAALLALSWFVPNHYSIFTAYALVAAVAIILAVQAIRNRPLTHHSSETPNGAP